MRNSQVFTHFPVEMSQSFIVLSAAPESMYLVCAGLSCDRTSGAALRASRYTGGIVRAHNDSQSQATVQTLPVCPLNVPSLSPFEVNHTLITGSFEAENSRSPSELKTI